MSKTSKPLPRSVKLSWCDRVIQRVFRWVGEQVGAWPIISILIAVLVLCVSMLGFLSIRMHQNLKSGYTDDNAPSIQEYNAVQWFVLNVFYRVFVITRLISSRLIHINFLIR